MYAFFETKGSILVKCLILTFLRATVGVSETNANYNNLVRSSIICIKRLSEWFKYCNSTNALAELYCENGVLETIF